VCLGVRPAHLKGRRTAEDSPRMQQESRISIATRQLTSWRVRCGAATPGRMCYTVAVAGEVQERDVSAGGEQPLHMRDQFVALDAVATSCVEGFAREVDRVVLIRG
jgi:hypothetical protein